MKLLTPLEFSKAVGVCRETVYRWKRAGKIKLVSTPDAGLKIPESEVENAKRWKRTTM